MKGKYELAEQVRGKRALSRGSRMCKGFEVGEMAFVGLERMATSGGCVGREQDSGE